MKTIRKLTIFSILAIALSSCNALAAKPTPTPIPTATSSPTLTSTPRPTITPTLKPSDTPVPPTNTPASPALLMPSGKPVSAWKDIPVMPTAIAGDDGGDTYSFIVKASSGDVQNFYENEMAKLGWNLFATGKGETDALLIMFMKGTDLVTISIIPQPDGLVYIILVK